MKKALGLTTDAELARALGLSRAAPGQWSDKKPIPKLRRLELSKLYPDVFDDDGRIIGRVTTAVVPLTESERE